MPKGTNQKLKLYYLAKIMVEKTDDDHYLTMPQIQQLLAENDITADRKSLYNDMEALQVLGIDVIGESVGRSYGYHVGSKKFEIAELQLLVDAIQSSKFITEKKSRELIKKLTSLVSVYEAATLNRQVVVQGRIKTMNESIYYIVNDLHNAIMSNSKIEFEYMQWNIHKEMVPRQKHLYKVSPWALTWDDENYYLIAYDSEAEIIKHYRVDKMKSIKLIDEKREGKKVFDKIDLAGYTKKNFGMFNGNEQVVNIGFKEEMVGVFLDRFGKDAVIKKSSEDGWYETRVEVALSDQFFGWIFGIGTNVKIMGPEDVRNRYKEEISARLAQY